MKRHTDKMGEASCSVSLQCAGPLGTHEEGFAASMSEPSRSLMGMGGCGSVHEGRGEGRRALSPRSTHTEDPSTADLGAPSVASWALGRLIPASWQSQALSGRAELKLDLSFACTHAIDSYIMKLCCSCSLLRYCLIELPQNNLYEEGGSLTGWTPQVIGE